MSSRSTSAEMNHLARIRDNQRRSRARRKEYLQELEERVRKAEQQGIRASTEIQAAARQVAEENRRLRHLLRLHGVNDRSIQEYLATGVASPPSTCHATTTGGNNLERLENLLGQQTSQSTTCSTHAPSPVTSQVDGENNCSMAADLISTMTGANPHEVRSSLGCSPGMDCHVDNSKISSAIERLTEPSVTT
ncbi:hypothetical protein VTI74DRAFT_9563 [Chaetomium olivicolor]